MKKYESKFNQQFKNYYLKIFLLNQQKAMTKQKVDENPELILEKQQVNEA